MDDSKIEENYQNLDINQQIDLLRSILLSSSEYSIIATDLDGKILLWNEGAKRFYGYSADEILQKNMRILHSETDITRGFVDNIFSIAQMSGKWQGEVERIRKNGTRFYAFVTITLRKNADNENVGYTIISHDLTEFLNLLEKIKHSEQLLSIRNKELEIKIQEAQQANHLKSQFIANISHDLRTPLHAIIGFAELMHQDKLGLLSIEYKDYVTDILNSSRILLVLINNLLDLAKAEAGKMEFFPETVDVNSLIAEVTETFRPLIDAKNLKINLHVTANIKSVETDPIRLKQIFYNYLSNAFKFTPENGSIDIRVLPHSNDSFCIEVQDNGIGMKLEDLPLLFVEFQQVESGAAKKYAGTGLGLALTRRIVEAQGGQVGVRANNPNGMTFYAVLPLHPRNYK